MGVVENFHVENRRPTPSEVIQICDLVNESFGEADYDEGFFYITPEIYKFYSDTPQQDDAGYFIAFDNESGKIIGFFVVGCRYYTILGNGPYKCGTPTLLAVKKQYQGHGIGKMMGTFVKNLYHHHNYFAGFQSFEDHSRGLNSVPKKNRETFILLKRMEKMFFRPINMAEIIPLMNLKWFEKLAIKMFQKTFPIVDTRMRNFTKHDETQIMNLLNKYSNEMDFALTWDIAYIQWYTTQKNVRIKVFEEDGIVKGALMAIILQFQMKGRLFPIAAFENYRFSELSKKDQINFVKCFLDDLKNEGVCAAVDYGFEYQPLDVLKKNKFLPQKRMVSFFLEQHLNSEIYSRKPSKEWKIYAELR